jgi:hypothetical protein
VLTEAHIQEPKKRISRLRFLLELLISSVLLKVSTPVDGVLPILVFALGFCLLSWASVRRLRDIKKSVWWVSIILVAIPFGMVIGLIGLPVPDSTGDTFFRIVGGLYGIAYLTYLGVLLLKPSAYPEVASPSNTPNQPKSESTLRKALSVDGQNISRLGRLNGWQRIGVVLSALWCFGVVAKTCYESFEAASFNAQITECCEEEKKRPFEKKRTAGEWISACELLDVCAKRIKKPIAPQLQPLLTLLFLPVAAGWLVAFLVISTTKWVREGFKTK